MKFLYYLIAVPCLAAIAWIVYMADCSAEGVAFAFWPQDYINTKLILTVFLFGGYIFGRLSAWFGYAPLRTELRRQKKANKTLNKEHEKLNFEHEKLNETVSDMRQNIIDLQEKQPKDIFSEVKASQPQAKWPLWRQKIKTKLFRL